MSDPRLIGMTKPALISLVQSRNLRIEELQALLVRILVAGNVRPPTKLLEDIRAAIGEKGQ